MKKIITVKTKAHKKLTKRFVPELDTELQKIDTGAMIVRWAACLDVLSSDGTRSLVSLVSPGMQPWEYDGLISDVPCPFDDEESFLDTP